MDDIGYATLPVIPSVRGARRSIERQLNDEVGGAGRSAGRSAGEGFNRGFTGVLARLGTVIAAVGIGKAVGSLFSTGIKGAATLETQTTAFTSLLGSAAAAKTEIADLQKFAAATPFQQQDVIGYAQQYLALAQSVGLAKDQTIPFLTVVGNLGAVTGATQQDIANAIRAIAQMGSSGKVTLDNLNQVSEAFPGFNGAAAIAAATGQSTADVMKAISAGSISASVGVQALLKGMEKFPGAAGAMTAQSKTLAGIWSTFTDTIKIKLTSAFQQTVPTIKKALSQLTPAIGAALDQMAPAIAGLVKNLVPLLIPLTHGIGQILTSVFAAIGPALGALAPVVQPLANAFAQLVRTLSPLLTFAAQIVAQLGPPLIGIFRDLLTALQPLIAAFVTALRPVLPVIAQALTQIGQALAPVVAELANALAPVLPIIADAFARLVQALAPIVGQVGAAFVSFLQAIAPYLPDLARAFTDLAVAVAGFAPNLALSLQSFSDLASLLSGTVITVVSHLVDLLARAVGLFGDIKKAKDGLGGGGGFSLNALVPGFGPLSDALGLPQARVDTNDLKNAVQGLNQGLDNLFGTTLETGVQLNTLADRTNTANGSFGDAALSALSMRAQLAQLGLAARVTAGDVLGVAGAVIAVAQATADAALAKQQNAAKNAAQNAIKQAQDAANAVPKLDLPALDHPINLTAKTKKPKFDAGTLTSFLSQAGITVNPFTAALQSIFDSAKAAGKHLSDSLVTQLGRQNKRLIGLAHERDVVGRKLAKAQQALSDIVSKYGNEKSSVTSAFRSSVNLGTSGTGFDGKQKVTASNILAQVMQAVNRTKRFFSLLKTLRSKGWPAALLDQMAQVGVDALPQAQALASADYGTASAIKSQFKALATTSGQVGKFMADGLYGAGVQSAKGLVQGLQSQESQLTKAMRNLAKAMVSELKSALGIHSPSRVTRELGFHTGHGFALGIGDSESRVVAAAKSLSSRGLPGSQAAAFGRNTAAAPAATGVATRGDLLAVLAAIEHMQVVLEVDKERFATAVDKTRRYSAHYTGG